ncbi:MAG: hypothetical protein JO057_14885 [Chloroflexi bacterium]|nr:hypothetical protein [Chloroflexota bacterium]
MAVTFSPDSPETDRRIERLGLTALFLAAVAAVLVFFPPEGQIFVPVHAALERLFGHAMFVLPLALALASGLAFARRARPNMTVPWRRLIGLGVITIGLLPAEHLLGQSTGLVGEWFTGRLIEIVGVPLTVALTLAAVLLGSTLTFNLKPSKLPLAAR